MLKLNYKVRNIVPHDKLMATVDEKEVADIQVHLNPTTGQSYSVVQVVYGYETLPIHGYGKVEKDYYNIYFTEAHGLIPRNKRLEKLSIPLNDPMFTLANIRRPYANFGLPMPTKEYFADGVQIHETTKKPYERGLVDLYEDLDEEPYEEQNLIRRGTIQIFPDGRSYYYKHGILTKMGHTMRHHTDYNGKIYDVELIRWEIDDPKMKNEAKYEYYTLNTKAIATDPNYHGHIRTDLYTIKGLIAKTLKELPKRPIGFTPAPPLKLPSEIESDIVPTIPTITVTGPPSSPEPSLSPPIPGTTSDEDARTFIENDELDTDF